MPVTATRLTGDLAQVSVGATGAENQVLGLMEWDIDWKRKTATATTSDDGGHEFPLGTTDSWTATAKFAYIDGDPSQATNILAALSTPAAAAQFNFFPTAEAGRASWTGKAFITGIKLTSGVGKIVGTDVTLTGVGPLTQAVQLALTGTQAEN